MPLVGPGRLPQVRLPPGPLRPEVTVRALADLDFDRLPAQRLARPVGRGGGGEPRFDRGT